MAVSRFLGSHTVSVSRSLQVLAATVLIGIVGVTAQQLLQRRAALVAGAAEQLAQLDMVFAEQTGRAIETIDVVLGGVIEAIASQTPADAAGFNQGLARRAAGVRQLSMVAVADAAGNVVYASNPSVAGPLQAVGVAALSAHRANPGLGLRISEPLRAIDGRWTAMMTRRLANRDNAFQGIAVAFINLGYFEDFYKAVDLRANGAILLHHRDGTVLARFPIADSLIGSSFADLPPFRDILSREIAGTVVMTSTYDGSTRVLAIRALRAFPLAVSVSVEQSMVLAGWWREVRLFGVAALVAGVGLAGALLLLSQRTREVERLLHEAKDARNAAEAANRQLTEQMTERERAEAALSQSQRMEAVGQLTGGVAHDFNNLLTVILGNIDVVRYEHALAPGLSDRLDTMHAAAERGASLTSQMLAFARRQPLAPRDVGLNTLVQGMRDLLNSALGANIQIELSLRPDLWPALVDPTQMELVVLNLAINARDAMPNGGRLVIATDNRRIDAAAAPTIAEGSLPPGDYVMVSLVDEGSGMLPEVAVRAFEPFYTTKPPGAGSGMGLAHVLGVVRQSGGGIHVDTAPGRGSSFQVFLPRSAVNVVVSGSGGARPASAVRAPEPARVVILVVDDVPAVLSVTARVLRMLGHTVREAESAAAALRILQEDPLIDVLLTDLVMPVMSGAELAREVARLWPRLPIVFMSGYADPEVTDGLVASHRLVRKPFRPNELASAIQTALEEARAISV